MSACSSNALCAASVAERNERDGPIARSSTDRTPETFDH